MPYALTLLAITLASMATAPISFGASAPDEEPLVPVVLRLDDAPLATYRGGAGGLAATQPAATGSRRLEAGSARSAAYLRYLDRRLTAFESSVRNAVPRARTLYRFRAVVGGLSMLVPASEIATLAALPGVRALYRDEPRTLDTERSPKFIGANKYWSKLGGQRAAGEGIVVGVLDSGIWPEHPSFSDPDPLGKPYPAPPATWNGGLGPVCEPPLDGSAPLACNNKLIGARSFLATYKAATGLLPGEFDSARDQDGHGTHTASTAAGNPGVAASIFDLPRGKISGIAPRAHVAGYRVCGLAPNSCYQSDSVAAIDRAVLDGVDVINFSISGSTDPYTDIVDLAFLDAYEAGVFVAASAGNDGPAPDTVNHRGGWIATVGASTADRQFTGKGTLAADRAKLKLVGSSVTPGASAPVVLASTFGDELCLSPFAAGTFAGEIVACKRGVNARVLKGFNVQAGGAGGLILYNATAAQNLVPDAHHLPALHVASATGTALIDFLGTHASVTGTLKAGKKAKTQGDVLGDFSSRGSAAEPLGISKPDLVAPGLTILAGVTAQPLLPDAGPAGQLFGVLDGTSMAGPHVAGAAALVKALHPDWTPGRIKSALMTTASTKKLVKEDGVTAPTPFEVGSGRLDLAKAVKPGLTFDVPGPEFDTHKSDLWNVNYPSVYVPAMPALLTVQRTAHGEVSKETTFALSVTSAPDLLVGAPAELAVPPGADVPFSITLDASAVPPGGVRHASLQAKKGALVVTLPITIVRAP